MRILEKGRIRVHRPDITYEIAQDMDFAGQPRVMYFQGRNGVGKTTFIEQVLIPAIRTRQIPFHYLSQELADQLYVVQAVLSHRPQPEADPEPDGLIPRWLRAGGPVPCLIADEYDKHAGCIADFYDRIAKPHPFCVLVTHNLDEAHQRAARRLFPHADAVSFTRGADRLAVALGVADDRPPGIRDREEAGEARPLVLYLELEDGQWLGTSTIGAADSSVSVLSSEVAAFEQLNRQLRLEMARVYGLSGDVERAGPVFLLKSNNAKDIPNRQVFALIAPSSGHRSDLAGFAMATTSHEEKTVLQVSRLWRDLAPGSWAMPYTQPVFSLYLHLQPPLFGSYSQYGLYLQGNPLDRTDWGLGLNIIRAKDSFDDLDYGVGLSAFGRHRINDGARFDLGVKLGADLDIPFRRDEADNSVSTLLFSCQAAMTADVLLTPCTDLIWSAGYRISNRANRWDYSDEEESYPAQWQGAAPSISTSGFFAAVGFRYSLLEFVF